MSPNRNELPELKLSANIGASDKLYDVQFYPYNAPGIDPVFAATGSRNTLICRPGDSRIEVLRWFEDDQDDVELNSVAWSKDALTGHPMLCVSGSKARTTPTIKVLDVTTGRLKTALSGHGAAVNDLKVSPLSPSILASASEDHQIRIWSLEDGHSEQPCVAVCAGIGGHRMPILSIAFHSSGKYILSGAMDTCIKMWALPDLQNIDTDREKAIEICYPHFSTSEVHSEKVDCVSFYGDLVLSKSADEHRIVLWRIKGFNSEKPVPNPWKTLPAKVNESGDTQSAFGSGWEQLLAFDAPFCAGYYMRFSLFQEPSRSPVLAIGNQQGQILFWNLEKLETSAAASSPAEHSKRGRKRKGDPMESSETSESREPTPEEMNPLNHGGPLKKQPAHRIVQVPTTAGGTPFMAYQCAWSAGGEWFIAAGEGVPGDMHVLRRWHDMADREQSPETEPVGHGNDNGGSKTARLQRKMSRRVVDSDDE